MNKIRLFVDNPEPKILCLGAHSDDIEIGCGGTILRLVQEHPKAEFYWVVFSAKDQRAQEAYKSAESFLGKVTSKSIHVEKFRDSYFPYIGASIKDYFVDLKKEFSPDLILTHYSNDAHQDHQLIAELTWNAFRDNLIMEYEIAKYDADLGVPNFYVHLDESYVKRKTSKILKVFESQIDKQWFGEESFRSIMRIRGLESNSPSKYAEAFYCRKIVV
jgi:LmbE family N-acetylglucosaminyl deacetylase